MKIIQSFEETSNKRFVVELLIVFLLSFFIAWIATPCFGAGVIQGVVGGQVPVAVSCTVANDSSQISSLTNDGNASFGGTTWKTQSFTTVGAITVTGWYLDLRNWNCDTNNAVASLYTTASGLPSVEIANTTVTVACSTIPNNPSHGVVWFQLETPYVTTASTMYAIVVRATGGTLYIYYDSANPYAGGTGGWSLDSGSSFTADTGSDHCFDVWGCSP